MKAWHFVWKNKLTGKMGNIQSVNTDVCDELCEHNTDRKMEEKRTKCGSSTNRRKMDWWNGKWQKL